MATFPGFYGDRRQSKNGSRKKKGAWMIFMQRASKMTGIEKFIKRYNKKSIEDAHGELSSEFKTFAKQLKNAIATDMKIAGGTLEVFNVGHYCISAFVKLHDQYVYISYDCPRYETPIDFSRADPMCGVLYRNARNVTDYTGGQNHFCKMADLIASIDRLTL